MHESSSENEEKKRRKKSEAKWHQQMTWRKRQRQSAMAWQQRMAAAWQRRINDVSVNGGMKSRRAWRHAQNQQRNGMAAYAACVCGENEMA